MPPRLTGIVKGLRESSISIALHITLSAITTDACQFPAANYHSSSDNASWLAEDRLIAVRDRQRINDPLGHL